MPLFDSQEIVNKILKVMKNAEIGQTLYLILYILYSKIQAACHLQLAFCVDSSTVLGLV